MSLHWDLRQKLLNSSPSCQAKIYFSLSNKNWSLEMKGKTNFEAWIVYLEEVISISIEVTIFLEKIIDLRNHFFKAISTP